MAKAKQHFVPCVYLKRWSPNCTESVYFFDKHTLVTDTPRNVTKILYNRHTYTICFEDLFVLNYMPEIKKDFAEQVIRILEQYQAVAFLPNGEMVSEDKLISDTSLYNDVENWDFRKKDNIENLARQKAILSKFQEIRSYLLETSLDNFIEKKWNSILDNFIDEVEKGYMCRNQEGDICINKDLAENVVSVLVLFMCRNPRFDFRGILPNIEQAFRDAFLSDMPDESNIQEMEDRMAIEHLIERQIRGAKLTEVYKALFNDEIGFFKWFFTIIKKRCQIAVLRCPEESGSFITSDNPAFTYFSNVTRVNYNAIYFPLTPQYLLMIGKGGVGSLDKINVKTVTNTGVKHYNQIILNSATENIVSDRKNLGYLL